jgi:opacity protein-like surface antigen
MNTLIKSTIVLAALIFTVSSARAQDEINQWEIFGGYAYMNLNRGIDPSVYNPTLGNLPGNRVNAHGFNGSVAGNWSRYLGAKFDVSFHGQSQTFSSGVPFKLEQKVNQYMGGIQVKDNLKDGPKWKPFGHALFGLANQHFQAERLAGNVVIYDVHSNDFAMKMGAGLDFAIHKNIDIRVIQFDWNPIFRGDKTFGTLGNIRGVTQNNMQLTFGVAFH